MTTIYQRGYLSWQTGNRFAKDQFMLDGTAFTVNCFISGRMSHVGGIPAQQNMAQTGGTQTVAIGGDQPANLRRRIFDVEIQVHAVEDYELILSAASKVNTLVSFMPGLWAMDQWHLDNANVDPTTWKTSRGIWLGSPTDTTVYAPKFFKRTSSDAAWTVIHTGTPTGTQAKFPAATNTTPFDIETATLDETEDAELWARYMAVHWVQILSAQESHPDMNDYSVSLTLEETLIGSYTGLS